MTGIYGFAVRGNDYNKSVNAYGESDLSRSVNVYLARPERISKNGDIKILVYGEANPLEEMDDSAKFAAYLASRFEGKVYLSTEENSALEEEMDYVIGREEVYRLREGDGLEDLVSSVGGRSYSPNRESLVGAVA